MSLQKKILKHYCPNTGAPNSLGWPLPPLGISHSPPKRSTFLKHQELLGLFREHFGNPSPMVTPKPHANLNTSIHRPPRLPPVCCSDHWAASQSLQKKELWQKNYTLIANDEANQRWVLILGFNSPFDFFFIDMQTSTSCVVSCF